MTELMKMRRCQHGMIQQQSTLQLRPTSHHPMPSKVWTMLLPLGWWTPNGRRDAAARIHTSIITTSNWYFVITTKFCTNNKSKKTDFAVFVSIWEDKEAIIKYTGLVATEDWIGHTKNFKHVEEVEARRNYAAEEELVRSCCEQKHIWVE